MAKAPPRPGYELDQLRLARGLRDDAATFAPVVQRRLADVADPTQRMLVARGRAGADAMQASGFDEAPAVANTPFQKVLQRSRALSRVGMFGDRAVLQQQLRDRIGLASIGQQFRTNQAGDYSRLSQMEAETQASRMRAAQITDSARANLFGTLAGAGLRYGAGKFTDWRAAQQDPYSNGGGEVLSVGRV